VIVNYDEVDDSVEILHAVSIVKHEQVWTDEVDEKLFDVMI
jgi:hypothetical protein